MDSFINRLELACATNKSLLCIGLDIEPSRIPVHDPLAFNKSIIDATHDLCCAFKPNLAFYEAMGIDGLRLLEKTIDYIRTESPTNVIIGDAKRGDIGPSGVAYAKAMFEVWNFDAVTINAWGGYDTVDPFISDEKRGAFIWCRGSNPGSGDLQDLKVQSTVGKNTIYEIMAQSAQRWNKNNNIGLVVGATVTEQLKSVRTLCPTQPILIPGVGAQGGDLSASVLNGIDSRGRLALINSSRGIIYASQGPDFPVAARQAAEEVNNNINSTLETVGHGWT